MLKKPSKTNIWIISCLIATHWDGILGDENGWGQKELKLGFFVGLVHLKAQPVQQNTGTRQVVHIAVLQGKPQYTVLSLFQL